MNKENKKLLEEANRTRVLTRIWRTVSEEDAKGYVYGIGDHFVLVAVVADDINFDGFDVIRLKDIDSVEAPTNHSEFVEKALALRHQENPSSPKVALTNIQEVIQSAASIFPLITIHREIEDSEICNIGRIVDINFRFLRLEEISPDGQWVQDETTFSLAEVTRIQFGGRYEEALWLVAQQESGPDAQPLGGRRSSH